jgi:hypothetical protein
MSGKQNKMPGWKEDFLQWERSGAPANEMLWGKLQTRLQQRRKKPFVYLLPAAAVLLVVFGTTYLLFPGNEKTEGPTANRPTAPIKTPVPVVRTPIVPGNPLQESSLPKQNQRQLKKITGDASKKEEPVLSPKEITLPETATSIGQKQSTADTTNLIIAEAPKKKLKVVHMNEWNSPPPPTYAAIKEAWETEAKRLQQETNISDETIAPRKKWSIFSARN